MPKTLEQKVIDANARLKAGKLRFQIEVRGGKLTLRGTLPPKPGSGKDKPYQQRIALDLNSTDRGIQTAEKEAKRLSVLLDSNQFNWAEFMEQPEEEKPLTVQDAVSRFNAEYFTKRKRTPQTESTWRVDYDAVYRHLPPDAPLSPDLLLTMVRATQADSRQRKRYCMALNALARSAGLKLDFSELSGDYSPKKVSPRSLPTDEQIVYWRNQIKNESWQWIYSMCATYGLRPHECFHIVSFDNEMIEIGNNTKTGSRIVFPFYPEWFNEWKLDDMKIPELTVRNNQEYGMRASGYFNRQVSEMPYNLYDLRHCWAVRTIEFSLPIELAAQQMGHSVAVHTDLYHAWITPQYHRRIYEALMGRSERPKPPTL